MKIGIICSKFNSDLVNLAYQDAIQVFSKNNFEIETFFVPGAGEIPQAAQWVLDSKKQYAGLFAIGVVIRGETSHYDFLLGLLKKSLWDLQKTYSLPLVFSVFTVESRLQAEKRIKEKKRGMEQAQALVDMIELKQKI